MSSFFLMMSSAPLPTHIAGKTEAEVEAELKGVPDADRIRPHKVFEGNRVRAQLIYYVFTNNFKGVILKRTIIHNNQS